MRKSILFVAGAVAALALGACSSTGSNADQSGEASGAATAESGAEESGAKAEADNGEVVTLTVGASPSPHGKILRYLNDNLPADSGIAIEVVDYSDYIQPNEALNAGDLDANFFQTVPYLESESASRGYEFEAGKGVHLEPLGIYSDKYTDIKDLPDGAKIGVINDPSNQARALSLLAAEGLVELPAEGDASVANVTPLRGITLQQVEGPLLVRTLTDLDAAVINGNFAQEGGLVASEDALVIESPENNPAVNVLVWKKGTDKAEAIKELEALLHSDQTRKFIEENWTDGSVIPAF